MNFKKFQEMEKLFYSSNGYLTTNEFLEKGFSNYYLSELIKEDIIDKTKRGLYRWKSYYPTRNYEMIDVSKIVPMGVFCLWTSFNYYNLGSYPSRSYFLAIDNKKSYKPKLPKYPPIQIKYFTGTSFSLGIEKIKLYNRYELQIYNMEKTICDFIRLRKINIHILKEALIDYLNKPDSNLVRLIEYAKVLGVYRTIKNYLDMLL